MLVMDLVECRRQLLILADVDLVEVDVGLSLDGFEAALFV